MITYQSNKSHKVKNKTSARKSSEMVKKPRPLSGYTLFGKENMEKFKEEMKSLDTEMKYVEYMGRKWKQLTSEQQQAYKDRAAAVVVEKATNQIVPISYRVSHVMKYGPFYLSVLLLLILFGLF